MMDLFSSLFAAGSGAAVPAAKAAPMVSPATKANPFDFNPMGGGPKAPPQMSPATKVNPFDVNLDKPADKPLVSEDMQNALLSGAANAFGGNKQEAPQAQQAPAFQGGGYFTNPGAQAISNMRMAGQLNRKGILG